MASTISRFCEFYVRESGPPGLHVGHTKRLRATAGGVAARGAAAIQRGFIRARAGPNRDHRCAVNLGLLDRAAGVSGGIAALPALSVLNEGLLLRGHPSKT